MGLEDEERRRQREAVKSGKAKIVITNPHTLFDRRHLLQSCFRFR